MLRAERAALAKRLIGDIVDGERFGAQVARLCDAFGTALKKMITGERSCAVKSSGSHLHLVICQYAAKPILNIQQALIMRRNTLPLCWRVKSSCHCTFVVSVSAHTRFQPIHIQMTCQQAWQPFLQRAVALSLPA